MCDQTAMCDELGSDRELLALLKSEGDEGQAVLDHIESCSLCQQRLDSLAADQSDLEIAVDVLTHRGGFDSQLQSQSITEADWSETMAMKILSPASHPEMLGRIGRYDIERFIGSGGMGVVFKAYDSELNRPVAIKVLAPYLSGSGAARNRFAREARAAAAVVDDHVVPIHNVESEDEHPFLVMKYISGASLQQRIDGEGPFDVREILRIGMQTAKGLAVAHAQGLIHRDVKPSNILLDEGVERALLTDFGLARASDDANLTRSGFQPGTPHYMSPEQVRGEALDARSDLFGLGCVMYAMCTGHSPFRSESSYAVMRRITDEEPRPIQEINPDVPAWLSQLIMKLLSKPREDRFDSAEQVASVLEGCLAHVQQPTVVPLPLEVAESGDQRRTGWRIGRFVAAAAFSLLAIFAGVILLLEMGKGTLRIETNGVRDVPIRITQGEKVYSRLTISQEGARIRLKAGKYRIEIDDTATHFTMNGATVTLTKEDDPRHEITADEVTLRRGDD
ncbi:MAG: serine/threonine-protein kinase, partial [Planctomycetota bacterium]